jgi:glycosyltransferase involved in cell wall biosynthesis
MTTDAVGGVWRYAVDMSAELGCRGWSVSLGVIGPAPSRAQELEASATPGVDVRLVDAPLDWLAGSEDALDAGRAAIAAAAAEARADIIQLNQPAYWSPYHPAPCVAVAHSCLETWTRVVRGASAPEDWIWHGQAVRSGLDGAAAAIAPSASFAQLLADAYGLGVRPLAVHNGAPPHFYFPRKDEYVLAAGRAWDEAKNFAVLDAAAPSIGWQVRLAGETRSPDNCHRAQFENLICLGKVDGVTMATELACASIFVSPSLYEPFGLAVLEAAQAGAALALADIPTFRELWAGAAEFFDPRDPRDLARAVNLLAASPDRRATLANAARVRAIAYSIERAATDMEAVYARLAPRARSHAGLEA